jgi:hypothetical protein
MNQLVQTGGWTLLHFIWQGAVIALTTAIVLSLLETGSARLRYAVSCVSLLVMLVTPAVTMLAVSSAATAPPSSAFQSERLVLDERVPKRCFRRSSLPGSTKGVRGVPPMSSARSGSSWPGGPPA